MIDSLNRPYRIEFDKKDSVELNKLASLVEIRDSVESQLMRSLDSFVMNGTNYCTVMSVVDMVIKKGYLRDPYAFFLDRCYIVKDNMGICELSTEPPMWISSYPVLYYLAGRFGKGTVDYLTNSDYLNIPHDERVLKCISYFFEECLRNVKGMSSSTKCECDKLMGKKMAADIVKYIRR
jgi:hypothetical protein